MLEIDTHKDIIRTFFRKTEQKEENPISRYLQEYDRLKYYKERLGLEESIKLMQESFQEIFITSLEDYIFWKDNIAEELNKTLHKLPKNYEYELKKAESYQPKVKELKK